MNEEPNYKETQLISLNEYCPGTKYPLTVREIIQDVVNKESWQIYNREQQVVPQVKFEPLKRNAVSTLIFYKTQITRFANEFRP